MTGTRPAFGDGSLSFSVNRHGTVSTSRPLCASAIRVRQQNGLKRRSASAPHKSYIVIAIALPSIRDRHRLPDEAGIAQLYSIATALAATAPRMTTSHGGTAHSATSRNATRPSAKSAGPKIAAVQTGRYSAASSSPTTAALIPSSAARTASRRRSASQNGNAPTSSRNDGRK